MGWVKRLLVGGIVVAFAVDELMKGFDILLEIAVFAADEDVSVIVTPGAFHGDAELFKE